MHIIIKKDKSIPGYNWLVWNSEDKSGDLVRNFSEAIRFWLWRMGVPAKIAFFNTKSN